MAQQTRKAAKDVKRQSRFRSSTKPEWQLKLVKERIETLFNQAEKSAVETPGNSRRYIELMRKMAMRYTFRLPKSIKRRICKACNSFLIPGENCIVRTSKKQQAVITTCKNCGNISRYPYRREKSLQ